MASPIRAAALAVMAGFGVTAAASAQFATGPLPANAYIVFDGLDWAWANPLPAADGAFTLAGQAAYGWAIPTAEQLADAPLATDFLFPGGNVPFDGTDPASGATFNATNPDYTNDGACATPWFSATFYHCDWQDGLGQPYGPWAGMDGAYDLAEQLVVRADQGTVTPEPGTMSLLATGLIGLAGLERRRRRRV